MVSLFNAAVHNVNIIIGLWQTIINTKSKKNHWSGGLAFTPFSIK